MGVTAGLKLRRIAENVTRILAIELTAAAQGIEFAAMAGGIVTLAFVTGTAAAYGVVTLLFELPFKPDWPSLLILPLAGMVVVPMAVPRQDAQFMFVQKIIQDSGATVIVWRDESPDGADPLLAVLASAGHTVRGYEHHEPDLAGAYFRLTGSPWAVPELAGGRGGGGGGRRGRRG